MSKFERVFQNKKVFFLDLDGTVYMGNSLIPGAKEFLGFLQKKGIVFYFLSNNSSRSKTDYVQKLSSLGIPTGVERIILSTDGVIEFLSEKKIKDIYVVGTESMRNMFIKAGFTTESNSPLYVILGFDTELTYEKLKKACLFIQNGIDLIATHPDLVCPTPEGFIPDTGSMLALIEKATHKKPLKIFGKPNAEMVAHVMKRHAASPHEVAMIGDRIYTDMELAKRIPCDFILVLSGETTEEDVAKLEAPPALIAQSLAELIL
jgi:HAD superfamily hydrolase (TIGR01457 family)